MCCSSCCKKTSSFNDLFPSSSDNDVKYSLDRPEEDLGYGWWMWTTKHSIFFNNIDVIFFVILCNCHMFIVVIGGVLPVLTY